MNRSGSKLSYAERYDDMSQVLASKLRTFAFTQTSFLKLGIRTRCSAIRGIFQRKGRRLPC